MHSEGLLLDNGSERMRGKIEEIESLGCGIKVAALCADYGTPWISFAKKSIQAVKSSLRLSMGRIQKRRAKIAVHKDIKASGGTASISRMHNISGAQVMSPILALKSKDTQDANVRRSDGK